MKNKNLSTEDIIDLYRKRQGIFPYYSDLLRNELYRWVSDEIEVYALDIAKGDRALSNEVKSRVLMFILKQETDILERLSASYLRVLTKRGHYEVLRAQKARESKTNLYAIETFSEAEPESTTRNLAKEDLNVIFDLVNLSSKEQKVLTLWANGYSYEEIADELEMRSSSIRTFLFRVKKKLRAQFFDIEDEL